MGKKFLFITMLLIGSSVSAQVLSEKQIEEPTGKKSGIYGRYGLNSAVKGGGNGPVGNTMVAAAEVTKLKDNGFVIRTDYSFSKYSDNGDKQWTSEIKPFMGLQNRPQNVTIGDKSGFYFIELKQANGTDFFITRFDNQGKIIQLRHMPTVKTNENVAFFISEKGLNVVHVEVDKKANKNTYKLLTFSAKDLAVTEKVLDLETDAFEVDKSLVLYPRMMLWNELKVLDDKIVLFKSYRKEDKDQKIDQFIVKTVELSTSGVVSNLKSYTVESPAKCLLPSLEISADGKDLYVFGYTTIRDEKFTDGLFIHKIDYATNNYIFKKEYKFSSIAPGVSLEEQNFTLHNLYPVRNLIKGVYEFDNNNGQFNFFLFKGLKTAMSNLYLSSVNIDTDGNVTSVYENKYDVTTLSYKRFIEKPSEMRVYSSYLSNGNFFMSPITSEKKYLKSPVSVMSPLDFIATNPDNDGSGEVVWCVVPDKQSNTILQFTGANSGIRMFKLKK